MSVDNPHYGEMSRNPICLDVPWRPHRGTREWEAFSRGGTGYPFVDAGVRQLLAEGWVHHVVRNALACFLTRGERIF